MAAAYAGADLLALQANIKRDPDGYKDEFLLQYRHFLALLDLYKLKPSKDSKEFADLALFMAQVIKCFPDETAGFASHIMELLDTHYAQLDSSLRKSLVQALILMRNRSQLDPLAVLPLFFRLFRCQDKALRHLLFRHIVSDIKSNNKHSRNEKLNRSLQNFMYGVIIDDNEAAAKKSLAVCTELWRRHVWRDARTVNVIASATQHKSSRIMLAVLKFFLGQDVVDEAGSDESGDEGAPRRPPDEEAKAKMPSKQDIYNAMKKGTRSSKKKKQAKLQRVMATVKKADRKGKESHTESFAAVHLLHDPQDFVEKLFSRLQSTNERFETRMAMIQVIARVVGVHKLQLLNFYPFLQKYIAPHQRDVTVILASTVMACHELVPPDTLAPVLKQLVDQFVHDKARPEVMTIGLKTVRELCLRAPLVMAEDLLQDLALYRKFRDKEVSSAAKGLIGLFRELNPAMLAKKDRGRGASLDSKPKAYGELDIRDRVDGAELLEAALAAGQGSEDDDVRLPSSDDSDMEEDGDEEGSSDEEGEGEEEEGEGEEGGSDSDDLESLGSSDDEGADPDGEGEDAEGDSEDGEEGISGSDADESDEEDGQQRKGKARGGKAAKQQDKKEGSLADLKRKLAEAKAAKAAKSEDGDTAPSTRAGSEAPAVLLEAERFLTEEDFARIKRLKQKALVEAALSKHGLASANTKAKRKRLLEAAEAEAEETAAMLDRRAKANETRLDPDDLKGRHKQRQDKEERMASVMAGREGREKFGGATGRKKQKTGGLSEKEKQKKKAMPIAARLHQLQRRAEKSKKLRSFTKNFKGKTARTNT